MSKTSEKIIRVKACYDCPFYTVDPQHDGSFLQTCLKTGKYIDKILDCFDFPDFCPLETGGETGAELIVAELERRYPNWHRFRDVIEALDVHVANQNSVIENLRHDKEK